MNKIIHISDIIAKKGFLLVLKFDDGEIRFIDFAEYLNKYEHEHNHKLKDLKQFYKVKVKHGSLFWPNTKRYIIYNNRKFVDYYNPDPEIIYTESKPFTIENFNYLYRILKKYNPKLNIENKDLISVHKILSFLSY